MDEDRRNYIERIRNRHNFFAQTHTPGYPQCTFNKDDKKKYLQTRITTDTLCGYQKRGEQVYFCSKLSPMCNRDNNCVTDDSNNNNDDKNKNRQFSYKHLPNNKSDKCRNTINANDLFLTNWSSELVVNKTKEIWNACVVNICGTERQCNLAKT